MASPMQAIGANDAQVLTKSDTTTYDPPFDAFWVGGAGDIAIRTRAGRTVTISGCAAGSVVPIAGDRLMSANTSATLVAGLRY